jgi:4a-hydroxytetrahydrobiopterin dehydratase
MLKSDHAGGDCMPKLLAENEIRNRLKELNGWNLEGAFITKTFEFDDFKQGIRFVNKVAASAEKAQHHPDFSIRYSTVKLSIQTHSEGGVTERDFRLARAIDQIQA